MKKKYLIISICVLSSACSDGSNSEEKKSPSLPITESGITESSSERFHKHNDTPSLLAESSTYIHPEHLKPFLGDLDEMKERRVIRALVTYSKTDFFIHNGQIKGLQPELLQQYEKELNKNVNKPTEKIRIAYIPVKFNQLIPALNAGLGDISAALLTQTSERKKIVNFTETDNPTISEVLISHRNAPQVKTIEELAGKTVYVLKNSSYAEHLYKLNAKLSTSAPINIIEADDKLLTEDIIEIINAGIFDYTFADDYKAKLWAEIMPNIKVNQEIKLSENNSVGWAIRKGSPLLQADLNRFATKAKSGTLLGNILIKRYLRSDRWISNPLLHSDKDNLIKLMPIFKKYAKTYELDPIALAAQGYQESKLNQSTMSHKGAVGIMQIMPATALDKNVAITNIDKTENNIHAGTKYMAFLRDRYFADPAISSIDQFLLSLAAYNAGPSNVRKMRKLTTELGLDPNKWFGNVEIAAGKIIGSETVQYVSNIYKYYLAYSSSKSLLTERESLLEKVNVK